MSLYISKYLNLFLYLSISIYVYTYTCTCESPCRQHRERGLAPPQDGGGQGIVGGGKANEPKYHMKSIPWRVHTRTYIYKESQLSFAKKPPSVEHNHTRTKNHICSLTYESWTNRITLVLRIVSYPPPPHLNTRIMRINTHASPAR